MTPSICDTPGQSVAATVGAGLLGELLGHLRRRDEQFEAALAALR